jgi:hypothetical protein
MEGAYAGVKFFVQVGLQFRSGLKKRIIPMRFASNDQYERQSLPVGKSKAFNIPVGWVKAQVSQHSESTAA